MAKIIRKYLVVLLADIQIQHGVKGIEFGHTMGREILTSFVPNQPEAFLIIWDDKFFLKRSVHTTRQLSEDRKWWVTTVITRYVQVDCIGLILEKKPKTRHQPTDNPYAAVLGDKNREFFESQMLLGNDEQ